MADQPTEKRRPGRQEKEPGRPKTSVMTFRVRDGMRERLKISADARNMSISEEVERRLDLSLDMASDPFKTIALRMITEQWKIIDNLTGGNLRGDDLYAYGEAAKKAVDEAVRLVNDPFVASKTTSESIKAFFEGVLQHERTASAIVSREDLADIADHLNEGHRAAREGEAIWGEIMAEPTPPKKTKAERDEDSRAAAVRKADPRYTTLTPEEMTDQMGPPGERYLQPKRKPKAS